MTNVLSLCTQILFSSEFIPVANVALLVIQYALAGWHHFWCVCELLAVEYQSLTVLTYFSLGI